MTQEGITTAGKILTSGEVEKLFGAPLKGSVAKMAWIVVQSDGDDSFRIAEVEGKTSIWNVAVALSRGQPRKAGGGLWSVLAIPRKVIGAPFIGIGGIAWLFAGGPSDSSAPSFGKGIALVLSPFAILGDWIYPDDASRLASAALDKQLTGFAIDHSADKEYPAHSSTHGMAYLAPTTEQVVLQIVTGSGKRLTFRVMPK
ncbi:MAG: hypothetical protein COV75_07380 [Candidatus Omnitrophica bacterium CG11_big_fil_rev_8_21_14_0_20_63_9]|nr:MAG: hypothetical protein COV75_07380 [Candidatus Omnitrophica bacterium CG11_big_fil_rev_8_21_14_0_20_63_9]